MGPGVYHPELDDGGEPGAIVAKEEVLGDIHLVVNQKKDADSGEVGAEEAVMTHDRRSRCC